MTEQKLTCQICGKSSQDEILYPAELVRPSVANLIKKEKHDWDGSGLICTTDLNRFRSLYLEKVLKDEKGEVHSLEKNVKKSLEEYELLSENVNKAYEEKSTLGQKLADKIAAFGGSWKFLIIFAAILITWILVNSTWLLLKKPFDPYPFILMNLILSCLAAIQAPVIMMSQNRQEAKDRLKNDYEYKINLKAELEVRHLNEKVDFLLVKQWHRLLEIQQLQTELMEELIDTKKKNNQDTE